MEVGITQLKPTHLEPLIKGLGKGTRGGVRTNSEFLEYRLLLDRPGTCEVLLELEAE